MALGAFFYYVPIIVLTILIMAVWAIVKKQSRILLVKRSPHTTRAGQWCLPGGSLNANESPVAACIREIKEETQLSVKPIGLPLVVNSDSYFCCELMSAENAIELKRNECVDYRWVMPHCLTEVGTIMNLRVVVPVLRSLGYSVSLSDELEAYIAGVQR